MVPGPKDHIKKSFGLFWAGKTFRELWDYGLGFSGQSFELWVGVSRSPRVNAICRGVAKGESYEATLCLVHNLKLLYPLLALIQP